jgi:hypothetical protein
MHGQYNVKYFTYVSIAYTLGPTVIAIKTTCGVKTLHTLFTNIIPLERGKY